MSILKAIILLGGLGLLFGAILAYASKKFAVEVDEREEKIGLDISQHGESAYPTFNGLDS